MKNIVESNKLIAEFMGWQENKNMEAKLIYGGVTYYFQKNDEACIPEAMCYHDVWNWLMPVVEKIKDLEDDLKDETRIEFKEFQKILALPIYTKIEVVYSACVDFINWYNKQNQSLS